MRAPKQLANAVEDALKSNNPISSIQAKITGYGVMALCVVAQELREIRWSLEAIAGVSEDEANCEPDEG